MVIALLVLVYNSIFSITTGPILWTLQFSPRRDRFQAEGQLSDLQSEDGEAPEESSDSPDSGEDGSQESPQAESGSATETGGDTEQADAAEDNESEQPGEDD
jgi:hypothetical protein